MAAKTSSSNIVNLNEIVPGLETVVFKYNDRTFEVPGDLPSKTVFEFLALFDDLLGFQKDAADAVASQDPEKVLEVRQKLQEITTTIEQALLKVFQIRQPELKEWPFGSRSTVPILGAVLAGLGIGGSAVAEDPTPPAPKPGRSRRTTQATTTSRSRKATSSRSRASRKRA